MGKYTIIAGAQDRPAFLDAQLVEKGSGQTILSGPEFKYALKPQDIGIPNFAPAWGMRVYEKGKKPDAPIDVKDPKYKGEIEFLQWGHKDGYYIECRFLKNYRTLDKQYQDLVLNAKVDDNDPSSSEAYFIVLTSGLNEFDENSEPFKVQFFKISSYNANSTYKNPDSVHSLFRELIDSVEEKKESKTLSAKSEALKIVFEAADDNSGNKISNLLGIVRKIVPDEPEGGRRFTFLQKLADSDPELFMGQIEEHKKFVGNLIEKGKSYDLFDLTKDGTIVAGQSKKEIIAEDVPAKGEQMLTWVYVNFLDQKASEAIFKLKTITDKVK